MYPEATFCVVDLPAPFGPSRATTSPARTDRLTPWTAVMPPYPARTSCNSRIGGFCVLMWPPQIRPSTAEWLRTCSGVPEVMIDPRSSTCT